MMVMGQNHARVARELVTYLGQDPGPVATTEAAQIPKPGELPAPKKATEAEEVPWYKQPVEAVRGLLGPFTVDTGTVRVESGTGGLLIRTGEGVEVQPTPDNDLDNGGGVREVLKRIPLPVYIGAGALVLFMFTRR